MTGIAPTEATDAAPTLNDFLVPEEGNGGQSLDDNSQDAAAAAQETEEGDDDLLELIADDEDGEGGGEGDDLGGDDDQAQPKEPAVPMPVSWSKDDAEEWGKLPAEAQEIVARREGERDKYLRKVSFEASQTRQQVESQARDVLAQMHENHARALNVYAQRLQPQEPDQRLLYSNDPNDVVIYQRQDAAFRAAQAQQQQLQQEIAQAIQHADLARGQTQQAELASDAQRLKEQLPEWFDPSEGPKLQQSLQSIGSELGYPAELMAEASSTDILALKRASDWKAKAAKYDALMAKKMEGVRAAKDLPRMSRPGNKPSRGQQQAASQSRRTQAMNEFGQTRSGASAAALLFERK